MRSKRALVLCSVMISLATFGEKGAVVRAAARGAASGDWVTFADEREKAFTLDVPQGWTVKGGLIRLGYGDIRPMVDMTSPDGKTNVRLGDVAVPSYSVPNQFHPREGETLDLGAEAQMIIANYRSGQDYAAMYARARFRNVCRSVAPQKIDEPLTFPEKAKEGNALTVVRWSTGEVEFKCDTSEGPRIVYAYAKTVLYSGFWQVDRIASFIAPADQVAQARKIILKGSESFTLNPRWIQYQKQMDAEGTAYSQARARARIGEMQQQVEQFENQMRAMQNQVNNFERGQAAFAKQVQNFDNIPWALRRPPIR